MHDHLDWVDPTVHQYQARYLLLLGHLFRAVPAELCMNVFSKYPYMQC
jgi:hypothetical protein